MKRGMLWVIIIFLFIPHLFTAGQETGTGSCANGKIAVTVYDREGTYLVYTNNPDGSDRAFVVSSNRQSFNWSPDACYVAYLLHREGTLETGPYDAYIMDMATSEVFRLTTTGYNSTPVWSPDGSRVVFASGEGNMRTLFTGELADILSGDPIFNPLTDDRAFNDYPAWSPDGNQLAFQSCTGAGSPEGVDFDLVNLHCEVYRMNADGTDTQNLTQNLDAEPLSFAWSPDGSQMAVLAYQKVMFTDGDLYLVNLSQFGVTQLTNLNAEGSHFRWSPDGSHIAFKAGHGFGYDDLYIVDVVGGVSVPITTASSSIFFVEWSPGGELAFASTLDGDWDIYLVNARGSRLTNLTNSIETSDCCFNAGADGFDWSPDGTQIVFDVGPIEGNFDIFIMDSDGSDARPLTHHEYDYHYTHAVWLRP